MIHLTKSLVFFIIALSTAIGIRRSSISLAQLGKRLHNI